MTVSSDLHQAKQPVSGAPAGPYGPVFHPSLVSLQIGAWVAGLVFDIVRRTHGSARPVAIGVPGAPAAAGVGSLGPSAIPSRTRAFGTGLVQMRLNLTMTAAGDEAAPAERDLPVPGVVAHGILAAATQVLMLPAVLEVGA